MIPWFYISKWCFLVHCCVTDAPCRVNSALLQCCGVASSDFREKNRKTVKRYFSFVSESSNFRSWRSCSQIISSKIFKYFRVPWATWELLEMLIMLDAVKFQCFSSFNQSHGLRHDADIVSNQCRWSYWTYWGVNEKKYFRSTSSINYLEKKSIAILANYGWIMILDRALRKLFWPKKK